MTLTTEDKKKKLRELLRQKDIGFFLTHKYGDQLAKLIQKIVYTHRVSLRCSKSKQNLLLGEIIKTITEHYFAEISALDFIYHKKCRKKVGLSMEESLFYRGKK